ncbi:MAG: LamG domain-containing protein [Armatimonadetes bacterium]|nr:LamG domain-containing protein [Armatimonadota bacterium]CUU35784.1 Concanavalin A-like lectin/glucanases superfamily [Armatimonadetes bacterium DC]
MKQAHYSWLILLIVLTGCGGSSTPSPTYIAYWKLDETPGSSTIADSIANPTNNHGAAQPGPVAAWGNFTGPTTVPAAVNTGLYFPGDGSIRVEVPNTTDLNPPAFYLEARVAPVLCGAGVFYPIVDTWDSNTGTGYTFYLEGEPGNVARPKLRMLGSTFAATATVPANYDPTTNSGTWTRVGVSVNLSAGTGVFLINGNPAGSFTFAPPSTPSLLSPLALWIGAAHTHPTAMWCEIGLDEVFIQ